MSDSKNSPGSKYDKNIPIRRVPLADQSQLPADYSATPGGTLFSTTPGGTRIVYERDFLLMCRESPLTKSPPPNMSNIPGVTHITSSNCIHQENSVNDVSKVQTGQTGGSGDQNKKENVSTSDDAQFQMEI